MNWLMKLAEEIKKSKDGDMITVRSEAAKEFAERAWMRMCPGKKIVFKIKENDLWNQSGEEAQ
jgi:hypothetical protein